MDPKNGGEQGKLTIVTGVNKSGKTTLMARMFIMMYEKSQNPIWLGSESFSNPLCCDYGKYLSNLISKSKCKALFLGHPTRYMSPYYSVKFARVLSNIVKKHSYLHVIIESYDPTFIMALSDYLLNINVLYVYDVDNVVKLDWKMLSENYIDMYDILSVSPDEAMQILVE